MFTDLEFRLTMDAPIFEFYNFFYGICFRISKIKYRLVPFVYRICQDLVDKK